MRAAFLLGGILSAVLFLGAVLSVSREEKPGRQTVVWASDQNPARAEQLRRFDQTNPAYWGRLSVQHGNDLTKLVVHCVTGVGPDVLDVYGNYNMASLVEAGILMDLTPYVESGELDLDNTWPSIREAITYEGRLYRLPCSIETPVVVYNRAIFEEFDVPLPREGWSMEDLIETGRLLRARAEERGERLIPLTGYATFHLLVGFGADTFSEDGLTCTLDSPEAVAAMRMRYRLMHEERVIPTAAEVTTLTGQGGHGAGEVNWFLGESAAMIAIGRWVIIQFPNYPGISEKVGNVRLPHAPGQPSSGQIDTRAVAVNAATANPEGAIAFMRYLLSETYNSTIVEDGDGIPPNPRFTPSGKQMVNAKMPNPEFHGRWLQAVESARPLRVSPFVDNAEVNRWIFEAEGFVDNRQKTPEQAMRDLAKEVNERIRRNLERHPALRERFREVTGRAWTPDWQTGR